MFDPFATNNALRPSQESGAAEAARQNAVAERNALVGELAAKGTERAAAPFTRRRMALFGAAFALATAAFAAVMLTSPPAAEADVPEGISITSLHARAPLDLGSAESGHEN